VGIRFRERDMVVPYACNTSGWHLAASSAQSALHCRSTLEWLLNSCDAGRAKRWAQRLVDEFGSLGNVLAQPPEILCAVLGGELTPAKHLHAFQRVILHALRCNVHHLPLFENWDSLVDYLSFTMARDTIERARVLFLDRARRLIRDEVLAEGSVSHCSITPRQIVRRAIELDASGILLVHNHPAGTAVFSPADKQVTFDVDRVCRAVGVHLHDHVVISRTAHASFCAENPDWNLAR
jgi:DNA repair protein RadC